MELHVYAPITDVFLLVFGSMGFLQLEEEKFTNCKFSHGFLGFFKCRQGIRIGNLLVPSEYTISFSMKLSPQH